MYFVCLMTAYHSLHADDKLLPSQGALAPANCVLIFLDDGESAVGAITGDLLTAFIQEAGPIIASASLIANISSAQIPQEKDVKVLQKTAEEIEWKYFNERSPEEEGKLKDIIVSALQFNAQIKNKWIVKEINSSLYLLLPKKYLQSKKISSESVEVFSPQSQITKVEQFFGLKVNHMKTVDVFAVQKPNSFSVGATDYFVSSLNDIFVTRNEFFDKQNISSWAIYLNGHGLIHTSVCQLSLQQFKDFLLFLEKIQTKLLVYSSCYAAGTNTNLIYKDSQTSIDRTYDFPIITQALTDAVTHGGGVSTKLEGEKIVVKFRFDYDCFVKKITVPDVIQYDEALRCISDIQSAGVGNVPQIRYPGLPWFSILDYNAVASIGSVMAKAHKAPLDVAKFFAKKGKLADPFGILLYSYTIPFEVIINTKIAQEHKDVLEDQQENKPGECYVPTFVSMIPGDAVHFIKKISSTCNTSDDILSSFYIDGLFWHKIFIIDEVEAPFSETMSKMLTNSSKQSGTLTNVVLDVTAHVGIKYFTYNTQVYYVEGALDSENPAKVATTEQKQKYNVILRNYGKDAKLTKVTPQLMRALKEQALKTFAQPMDYGEFVEKVIELLDAMPNNTALRIPLIQGKDCPNKSETWCWYGFFDTVLANKPINMHKVIRIDKLIYKSKFESEGIVLDFDSGLTDIIIDVTPKGANSFYNNGLQGLNPMMYTQNFGFMNTDMDYMSLYEKMFKYFDEHLALDETLESEIQNIEKKSVHELVTSESIEKLQTSVEKGVAKQKELKKIEQMKNNTVL